MTRKSSRSIAVLAAVAGPLLAGGCSMDDVAFNGKIFDAIGVNDSKKSKQPKMVARAPLVLPPGAERLPVPEDGPAGDASAAEVAALNDPDKLKVQNQEELERQQAAYCKEHYELPSMRDKRDLEEVAGPLGPCRKSFKSFISNMNSEEPQEGQVE
jgi:hypothetical protein